MKISKLKQNAVNAYNKGYRIIDGECYDPAGNIMKGHIDKRGNGYRQFCSPFVRYHQLVAYQKFGDAWLYSNLIVRHLDGNSLNNKEDNIVLGTIRDNALDIPLNKRKEIASNALRIQKVKEGVRRLRAKIPYEVVSKIKQDGRNNMRPVDISKKHNISAASVSAILRGLVYKDIL